MPLSETLTSLTETARELETTIAFSSRLAALREWASRVTSPLLKEEWQLRSATHGPAYPVEHVWASWTAFKLSLEGGELSRLWQEQVEAGGVLRPSLTAHILAGNTPLLGWQAGLRTLLVGSGCFLKMSRHDQV